MVDMTDFLVEPNDRATKHAIIVQCKVNIYLLIRKQTVAKSDKNQHTLQLRLNLLFK